MMENVTNENILDFLDKLGYSKSAAQKRVQIFENAGKGIGLYEKNKFGGDYEVVIAGSRGDGTGVYRECDIDKLLVQNCVRCTEKGNKQLQPDQYTTILELDTEDVPQGYAKLRFISKADNDLDELHNNIVDALEINKSGDKYLRNDCILSPHVGQHCCSDKRGWMEQTMVNSNTCTGPSKPYKLLTPFFRTYISLDDVLAFKLNSPVASEMWCRRERQNGWPSKDIIESIKDLDVYVVPVGFKGSDDEHLQWRISLTKAEVVLVQSFNDVQIKVYSALKMIAKHYLFPICDNITSYIIKNVVFWQMEQTGPEHWSTKYFNERLVNSLTFLKKCIEKEALPNYMIAARDMLQGKIPEAVKPVLIQKITSLIHGHFCLIIKYVAIKDILGFRIDDLSTGIGLEPECISKCQITSCMCGNKPIVREEIEKNMQADQGWFTVDNEAISRCLKKRVVREQFVLSVFTLPPDDCANILTVLFTANEQNDIVDTISKKVFPYIRKVNPYGFFNDIESMEDTEIYATCEGESVKNMQGCVLL